MAWVANQYPAEPNEDGNIFTAAIDYTAADGDFWGAKIEVHDLSPTLAENRAFLLAEFLNEVTV